MVPQPQLLLLPYWAWTTLLADIAVDSGYKQQFPVITNVNAVIMLLFAISK